MPSIREACDLFIDLLGGRFITGGEDPKLKIRVVHLDLAGQKLELMEPTTEDSYLQRFLDKHGPGFHHMTVIVEDLGAAIAAAAEQGREVVDEFRSDPAWQEAFLRPSQSYGTLIQLAEIDDSWEPPVPGVTLDAVLSGRVEWISGPPRLIS